MKMKTLSDELREYGVPDRKINRILGVLKRGDIAWRLGHPKLYNACGDGDDGVYLAVINDKGKIHSIVRKMG